MDVGMYSGGSNYSNYVGGYNVAVGSKRPYRYAFTTDTRGNEEQGVGASAQYNKIKVKWGRKRPIRALLAKLEKRNTTQLVRRFGKTNRFTDLVGGFRLGYEKNLTTETARNMPIYVLDLTGTEQSSTATGFTLNTLPAFRRLEIVNATGACNFNTVNGDGNDGGTNVQTFVPIKVVGSSFDTSATAQLGRGYNAGVLEWVNVKLLFRCPIERPGWIKCSVVQFQDDDSLPGASTAAHNAFWQKRAKALLYNPIAHEVTGAYGGAEWSGCRVLQQKVIRFNPDTTTNKASYNGEQHRYDLFMRLNRFVNQRSTQGQYQLIGTAIDNDLYTEEGNPGVAGQENNIQVYNTAADHRARVFLVIEGTYFDSAATAGTADNVFNLTGISFDMEARTKWVYKQPYA